MPHIEHPVRIAARAEHDMPNAVDATLFVARELSLSSWVMVASAPGEDKASRAGRYAADARPRASGAAHTVTPPHRCNALSYSGQLATV